MGIDQNGVAADSSAADGRFPPPDDATDLDERLMSELTGVTYHLGLYVLRDYGVEAGHVEPMSVTEERGLADSLYSAAEAIRARAERREQQGSDRR